MRSRSLALGLLALSAAGSGCGGEGGEGGAPDAVVRGTGPDDDGNGGVPGKRKKPDGDGPKVGPPAEPGPVLFDLMANRHLAHLVHRGAALVDGGAPGALKNVRGARDNGWDVGFAASGERAALLTTRGANLAVPLTEPMAVEARELLLRAMPPSPGARISLFLNEKPLGDVTLPAAGFQNVRVKLSPGVVVAGENVLRVFVSGKGTIGGRTAYLAIARVALGREGMPDPVDAAAYFDVAGDALRLAAPGDALAWYVQVPAKARLWLLPEAKGGCAVDVSVHEDATPVAMAGRARAAGAPEAIDLAAWSGHTVRLEMALSGDACPGLAIRDASLIGAAGSAPPTDEKPVTAPAVDHVVFWIVDAMRADTLEAYGGVEVETPGMDAVARDGTVFLTASIQGSESKVGAATLFTGTYPTVSKMMRDTDRLPEKLPVLAEMFRGAGWKTASYISNGYVSATWGFARGWDEHVNFVRAGLPSNAERVWGRAREWLTATKPAHAYLYMQPADTHVPYRRHAGILERYDPDPYDGPFKTIVTGFDLADFISKKTTWTDRDKKRVRALYRNAATFNDEVFGKMMAELPALLPGRTLVLISADHGEEFFDHGSIGHGNSLYNELTHVPLVMMDGKGGHFPPGTVVRDDVETADVMPTIAAAAGIVPPPTAQGRDLGPIARAATAVRYPRPAFSFQLEWWKAMRLGAWKLHVKGKATLLFDMESDPGEKTDVSAARPIALRHCVDTLSFFLAMSERWHKMEHGEASNHSAALAALLEKP